MYPNREHAENIEDIDHTIELDPILDPIDEMIEFARDSQTALSAAEVAAENQRLRRLWNLKYSRKRRVFAY